MKAKLSPQDMHELRWFVKNREARRITTPEFKSVLMILRQHCTKGTALHEWTNSVAHKMRNQGLTFEAGAKLWLEKFQIDGYFAPDQLRLTKIPIPIFDRLLTLLKDPGFHFGVDIRSQFPGGHFREEVVASIKWMYRKSESERVYQLVSRAHTNPEDLELMRTLIAQLGSSDWGGTPFHFDEIRDGLATTLTRLIGPSKRVIQRNANLLALHFLTAFHLTEVDLKNYRGRPKTRCFLSVDSTASGHLCLSLGLYAREHGAWDAIELSRPNWSQRLAGSHDYTRPFLLTDLEEETRFWKGTGSEVSFESAIKVVRCRNGDCVLRPVGKTRRVRADFNLLRGRLRETASQHVLPHF